MARVRHEFNGKIRVGIKMNLRFMKPVVYNRQKKSANQKTKINKRC